MSSKKKNFDLNKHTARLLMNEPFFASLSRRIEKQPSESVPTAGMRLDDDGNFTLLYNQEYFASLTSEEMTDVLKHEFYHIIFDHVTGRLPGKTVTKLWNFATDLAINSHLKNLPDGCLIPGEGVFHDFPKKLSAEKYHAMLKKMQEESPSGAGGVGDVQEWDSHEGWNQQHGEGGQIARERLKKILKDAVKEATSSGWGSLSQQVKEEILASLDATLDWKKVLRYFIRTSQKAAKSSTIKRINKRYPYLHPGRRTNRQARVAISVDQSGSVDSGMLAAFFSELNNLAKIATFTVIPFDSEVSEKDIFEWKKGQRYDCKRLLTGGTDFDAPTRYVNERDFDGHIILTDMEAPKPKASRCQRMWMTTPRNLKNPYFETNERIVAIDYED